MANQEDLQKSSSTKDSQSSSKGSSSLSKRSQENISEFKETVGSDHRDVLDAIDSMPKRSQAAYEDTGRQLEGWRKQAQEMADKMKEKEIKDQTDIDEVVDLAYDIQDISSELKDTALREFPYDTWAHRISGYNEYAEGLAAFLEGREED